MFDELKNQWGWGGFTTQDLTRCRLLAGTVALTISSMHGLRDTARRAYVRIAGFLTELRENAEPLDPLGKWYRILSEALRHFLHGRQLQPPLRLHPT